MSCPINADIAIGSSLAFACSSHSSEHGCPTSLEVVTGTAGDTVVGATEFGGVDVEASEVGTVVEDVGGDADVDESETVLGADAATGVGAAVAMCPGSVEGSVSDTHEIAKAMMKVLTAAHVATFGNVNGGRRVRR